MSTTTILLPYNLMASCERYGMEMNKQNLSE